MRLHLALPAAALVAALPAAARAAELKVQRPCYREGQQIRLTGGGFTPAGGIAISLDGQPFGSTQADGRGTFEAVGTPPAGDGPVRRVHVVATDMANPAVNAQADFRITKLSVSVQPRTGTAPDRRVNFFARGFATGRTLYLHYLTPRGRVRTTVRIGRVRGQCGTASSRRRLIPYADAEPGRWRLRFDTHPGYSSHTRPQVRLVVRVRPRP